MGMFRGRSKEIIKPNISYSLRARRAEGAKHKEPVNYTFFYGLSLQPEILAKKLSNSFATAQPQIGLFLSKQIVFDKSC